MDRSDWGRGTIRGVPSIEPAPGLATNEPVSVVDKLRLLARVWLLAVRIQMLLKRHPLPVVVSALEGWTDGVSRFPVALLSRAVSRGLRVGPWRPRCLLRSLVLYRMLRAQGDVAELVIGLKGRAVGSDAHAWVELAGRDVGPWPGGAGYQELTRYPRQPSAAAERAR